VHQQALNSQMMERIGAQKIILLCGAVAFILCGLFPPWLFISYEGHTHAAGFKFILSPTTNGNFKLDIPRLTVEWLCIAVATGTVWLLAFKPKNETDNNLNKSAETISRIQEQQVNPPEKIIDAAFEDKAEEAQIQAISQKTDHELLAILKQLDGSRGKALDAVRTELKKRFGVIAEKSMKSSSAVIPQNKIEAPQPQRKRISPTILNLISLGAWVFCCLLIFFTFKDVDFSRGDPARKFSLLAAIIVRTVVCAAILAWIVRGMTGKHKGYVFLTFSVVCAILVVYNAYYFRIGLHQAKSTSYFIAPRSDEIIASQWKPATNSLKPPDGFELDSVKSNVFTKLDIKAAEQGNADAQYRLGLAYESGRGAPQDLVEAYKWFKIASAQGNKSAKIGLSLIEPYMTPEQIAEGKRRADTP
jgi:hypothetical protein